MNHYLHSLNTWLEHRRLILSTEKSTVSLLTSWTLEMNQELNININGKRLATTKNPKSLGLTFDQSLNFNVHISATINKLKNRNNTMKALAGTNWGKEKETMLTAYKAINRPVVNYAAPIWSPHIRETKWKKLQVWQNAALRTSIGCHLMSSIDHLYSDVSCYL